jgi:hypothetical protein
MGTYPHHTDPSQESSTRGLDRESDPAVPRPLPQNDRKGVRLAAVATFVAVLVVVLIVLL